MPRGSPCLGVKAGHLGRGAAMAQAGVQPERSAPCRNVSFVRPMVNAMDTSISGVFQGWALVPGGLLGGEWGCSIGYGKTNPTVSAQIT